MRRLEMRLLNYFLLIVIAAMMIGVEFFFEMNRDGLPEDICQAVAVEAAPNGAEPPLSPLEKLRNKIVLMFGVLTVVVAIVLMMFIKNITAPLQKIVDVAEQVIEGDLSKVVHVEARDEIGRLGTAINELTSNLQEVATVTAGSSDTIMEKLKGIEAKLADNQSIDPAEIAEIKEELELLHELAGSFTLLQTNVKHDA